MRIDGQMHNISILFGMPARLLPLCILAHRGRKRGSGLHQGWWCRRWHTVLSEEEGDSTVEVWAPTTKYQLAGITRQNVLLLCEAHGIPCWERDFSLTSVYSAEEAFVTGTFAGLIPVTQVSGASMQLSVLA